ncbi:phage portal protein, partial [Oceanospirillum multiglobuliferum]
TSDENFGNASGVALEFKLQNMHNLAIAKERKFTSGLKQLFKLWTNTPLVPVDEKAYKTLKHKFTLNIPRNVSEEIENAKNLEGIVSKETQLSQLSFIANPLDELKQIEKEKVSDFDSFNELSNVSIDNPTGESILDNSEEQ